MSGRTDGPEWIRHRVKRWAGSARVGELTAAERGVYHELIVLEALAGPFKLDPPRLARRMRLLLAELEAAWPRLVELGLIHRREDGRWSNETVAEERARALEVADKRRAAGRQGAAKRWSDGPTTAAATAVANGTGDSTRDGICHPGANSPGNAEGEGDNYYPPPLRTPRTQGPVEPATVGAGAAGGDPPDLGDPTAAPPAAAAGVVPDWAAAELEALGMRDVRARQRVAEWASGWADPPRALRAAIAAVRRGRPADPAGLLAHAVDTGGADALLDAADRGNGPHAEPVARKAPAWDLDLERVVLGLRGTEGGFDSPLAEELAHQRYGGPEEARVRFARAVLRAGFDASVMSVKPLSAYREAAWKLLQEQGVACG